MVGTRDSDRGSRLAAPYVKGPEIKEPVIDFWTHKPTFIDGVGCKIGTRVPMTKRQAKYLVRSSIIKDHPPEIREKAFVAIDPAMGDADETIVTTTVISSDGDIKIVGEDKAPKKTRKRKK